MNKKFRLSLFVCASLGPFVYTAGSYSSDLGSSPWQVNRPAPEFRKTFVKSINRSVGEYKFDKLTTPVALPKLPVYTGKAIMVTAGVQAHVLGGPTYYMRFRTMEDGRAVIGWYKEVLRQNGWKIDQSMTNDDHVGAVDANQATCQIMTVPLRTKGYRSEFVVEYKYLHA